MKHAYLMTNTPTPFNLLPSVCEQADEKGFETVAVVPFGVMQAPQKLVIPGLNQATSQIPVYLVIFRKEYADNEKKPEKFDVQFGRPEEPKSESSGKAED